MAFDFYTVQQALASSSAAGNRAGLTLLGMAVAGHFGYIDFPPGISLLTTLPGIAGLAGLTLVEEMTERDEDMQDILQYVNYGTKGLAGSVAMWSVDMMPEGFPPWVATPLGLVLAGATHYYRMKLHETLRGMGDHWLSPRTYLVALETGGAFALVILLVLAPILALLILLAFLIAGGIFLVSRWALERQVMRYPCPECGKRIRKEASVCRYCSEQIAVTRWLAKDKPEEMPTLAEPEPVVPAGDVAYAAASSSDPPAS